MEVSERDREGEMDSQNIQSFKAKYPDVNKTKISKSSIFVSSVCDVVFH